MSDKKTSRRDYFKELTGKSYDDEFKRKRRPYEESLDLIWKKSHSNYDLRLLGTGEKEVWISEEERYANFHILGAPGEGKSKFLEDQIRKDIDAGNGLCLIDPSEGGDTAKNVLAYCSKIGYEKVIYIDPDTITKYGRTPRIAPLTSKSVKKSADSVMNAFNILFDTSSTATPRIRRYLKALLRVLAKSNLTLYEAKYFSQYDKYKGHRNAIYELDGYPDDIYTIQSVFRSEYKWDNFFASSVNRIDDVWQDPLRSMLSHSEGINFIEAVSKKWVILVNLSPYKLTDDESRLLGIIILGEIIRATEILFNKSWSGRFYLYIDEAGRFITKQIADILQARRKSGLALYLAHHEFTQFENQKVVRSVLNDARIKLMFNTPGYDDRLEMIKALGYGGGIPHVLAAYANQDLPKQYAIIKKNKETPVRIRIEDVSPLPPASEDYIKKILSQDFYSDTKEFNAQINARIVPTNTKSSESRKTSDSQPDHKTAVPRGMAERKQKQSLRKDKQKPPVSEESKPIKI